MAVDLDAVEFLTSMATYSMEELEAKVAALEEEKEATEAESTRRKNLIDKLQHQRVIQGESEGDSVEKKREEVAALQRLLSRSLTVSKTALTFLDQATLQQGQLSHAIQEKLPKLDIAHQHVISTFLEHSAAYAESMKSAPAAVPIPTPVSDSNVDTLNPSDVTTQRSIATMATFPVNVTGRETRMESGVEEMARTSSPLGVSQTSMATLRPSAVYGAAPALPGTAVPQPSPLPPNTASALADRQPQRRQLPSHITMISPEAPQAGARPMSAAAGTATVGGAVGVVSGLKLRPTSEFHANS